MREPQDSEEFINQQKAILADNPECANSHYNMGVKFLEQDKLDDALNAFPQFHNLLFTNFSTTHSLLHTSTLIQLLQM